MKKLILIILIVSLVLINGCTDTDNFKAEEKAIKEFYEENKASQDFVEFFSNVEETFRDFPTHEFIYGANIKSQSKSLSSFGQIGANEAYKASWFIHLCIIDENGKSNYYRGKGGRNNIKIDLDFPFDNKGQVLIYYNPDEYQQGKSFIDDSVMVQNCRLYIDSLKNQNNPEFHFFDFKTPQITKEWLDKFKAKEEQYCSDWASYYKFNAEKLDEAYMRFLSKEPLKYNGVTCCELFAKDNPASAMIKDCKDKGII